MKRQPAASPRPPRSRPPSDGVAGNERLTAALALLLLILLAAEGVTIVLLRALFPLHVFIGLVLLPLTAVKLASTGYRALRYYRGAPAYRRRGPPAVALRLMGPVVVGCTAGVLGSGVGLLAVRPGPGPLLTLHKAAFVLWFLAMSAHVLAHLAELPGLALADWRAGPGGPSRRWSRQAVVVGGLVAGVAVAAILLPAAGAWTHWVATVGGDG